MPLSRTMVVERDVDAALAMLRAVLVHRRAEAGRAQARVAIPGVVGSRSLGAESAATRCSRRDEPPIPRACGVQHQARVGCMLLDRHLQARLVQTYA